MVIRQAFGSEQTRKLNIGTADACCARIERAMSYWLSADGRGLNRAKEAFLPVTGRQRSCVGGSKQAGR
jgi:hypothetical protein